MTWNGRVSIHDDLSRLHAQSRAADTSREIGYSSVTQGEGSLDLLSASGAVIASLGDQPDGRFGIAHLHGGALRFLPDLFSDLEAEDISLSGRISGLGDRMVTAEGRLDAHNARIHDNDGRISGLGDRMVSVEGTLVTNDGRISGLGDRMVSAEGTLSSHDGRISGLGDRMVSAESRLDSHNSRIHDAQARADSAYSRAGTGISDAATAQSRADSAYSLAASKATQGQIDELSGRISKLRAEVYAWMVSARQTNPDLPPPIPS